MKILNTLLLSLLVTGVSACAGKRGAAQEHAAVIPRNPGLLWNKGIAPEEPKPQLPKTTSRRRPARIGVISKVNPSPGKHWSLYPSK